jgi:arylsulfatase A-like enzyme
MLVWRTSKDLARSGLPSLLPVGGHQIGNYFVRLADGAPFARRDEVYMRGGPDGDRQVGVVVGRTKLIHHVSLGYSELYDLEKDPWEQMNLAAARPEQVRLLLSLIRADSVN